MFSCFLFRVVLSVLTLGGLHSEFNFVPSIALSLVFVFIFFCRFLPFCYLQMLIYPLGIPLMYGAMLYQCRDYLGDSKFMDREMANGFPKVQPTELHCDLCANAWKERCSKMLDFYEILKRKRVRCPHFTSVQEALC